MRSVSAGSVCVCACVSACGYVTGSKAGLRVCVCACTCVRSLHRQWSLSPVHPLSQSLVEAAAGLGTSSDFFFSDNGC